ncbi:MAG: yrrB 8 [Schlesneria sp.]|nr:yrrB 8 [Schlesneria sp.]
MGCCITPDSDTLWGLIVRNYAATLFVILFFPLASIASDLCLGQAVFIKAGACGAINGVAAKAGSIHSTYTISDVNEDSVRLERKWFRKTDVMSIDEASNFYNAQVSEKPLDPQGWVCRAAVLSEKKNNDDALKDCIHAIELDPKFAAAYLTRSVILLMQDAVDEALDDCNTALKLDPHNPEAFLCRSAVWFAKDAYENAIKDCDEGIRLSPDDDFGLILRAEYRIGNVELNAAIADCDEVIKRDAKCSSAFLRRGYAQQLQGNITDAVEDYQQSIRLNPLNDSAYQFLAWVYATHPDQLVRNGTLAVEFAKKACEIQEYQDWNCIRTLAAAYAESGDYSNAVSWQNKATELAPADSKQVEREWAEHYGSHKSCRELIGTDSLIGKHVFLKDGAKGTVDDETVDPALIPFRLIVSDFDDTALWVGLAWVKKRDVMSAEEALQFCDEQIRRNPTNASAWRKRGCVHFENNEHAKAIEHCTQAIKLDPKDAIAYVERATIWNATKQTDKAIDDCTEAIKLQKDFARAYVCRARAWRDKKEIEKGWLDSNEAIRLDPDDAAALLARGLSWIDKGEYDRAIDDFGDALELDPSNRDIYINRAYAFSCRQESANAISDYTVAIRSGSRDAAVYNNRGREWQSAGELEKAIKDYTDAILIDAEYELAYANRGIAWYTAGKLEKAIDDFNQVITIGPNYPFMYQWRGHAFRATGDFENAIKDFNETIKIDPKNGLAYQSVAWLKATCFDPHYRDGKQAIDLATKGLALTDDKNRSSGLDTLAAAYAEAGEFEAAIKEAQKVVDLAPADKKAEYQKRLELYRLNQPYHEVKQAK